jgi:hypothetical protein
MRITHGQKPNPSQTAAKTAGQGPSGLDSDLANDHLSCRKVVCRHCDIPVLNGRFIEFSGKKWLSQPLL